jgi:phosphonate transport system substrate-binding protein
LLLLSKTLALVIRPSLRRLAFLLIASTFVCLLSARAQRDASNQQAITVALIPDGLTGDDRAPLRDYLTKAMGRPVKLVTPERYVDTAAQLADGSCDFALLGALTYVRSHAKDGVVPLVQRTSDLQFHALFIANDPSIRSLRDLKGKRFAFGDVSSTSGHLIPYRELTEAGVNPATDLKPQFSGSHPVTAALVQSGAVDAGVLDESVFVSLIADGKIDKNKVHVFYTSKPFVDYVFVSRKGLPEAEREKFSNALLELKEGQQDAVLKVLRAKKFVAANNSEYDTIRRIAAELKLL